MQILKGTTEVFIDTICTQWHINLFQFILIFISANTSTAFLILEGLLTCPSIDIAMASLVTLGRLHGSSFLEKNHLQICNEIVPLFVDCVFTLGESIQKHWTQCGW